MNSSSQHSWLKYQNQGDDQTAPSDGGGGGGPMKKVERE